MAQEEHAAVNRPTGSLDPGLHADLRPVLEKIISDPRFASHDLRGWWNEDSVWQDILAETEYRLGLIPLANLRASASDEIIFRQLTAVYSERLHDGVQRHEKLAELELYALVERSVRKALKKMPDTGGLLITARKSDGAELAGDVEDLISGQYTKWLSDIRTDAFRDPSSVFKKVFGESARETRHLYGRYRGQMSLTLPEEENGVEDDIPVIQDPIEAAAGRQNEELLSSARRARNDFEAALLDWLIGTFFDKSLSPVDALLALMILPGIPDVPSELLTETQQGERNTQWNRIAALLCVWQQDQEQCRDFLTNRIKIGARLSDQILIVIVPALASKLPDPLTNDSIKSRWTQAKQRLRKHPSMQAFVHQWHDVRALEESLENLS